jgi:hypothetical protein
MKCAEIQNLIQEYVDGELTHSIDLVEEHIKSCDACKAFYDETMELKNMLSGLDMLELPDDFEASLHTKLVEVNEALEIEKKVTPLKKYRTPMKWVGSIAAIALVSIAVTRIMPFETAMDANFASMEMAVEETAAFDNAMADEAVEEESMEIAESSSEYTNTEEATEESVVTSVMKMDTDNQVRMFTAQTMVLAPKGTVYHVNISFDTAETFIGNYDYRDLIVNESSFEFYMHQEDVLAFDDALKTTFGVTEEVFIDYSLEIESVKIAYENQKILVEQLEADYEKASESDKESLKADLDTEKSILMGFEVDLNTIKVYENYQQIIIILNEE